MDKKVINFDDPQEIDSLNQQEDQPAELDSLPLDNTTADELDQQLSEQEPQRQVAAMEQQDSTPMQNPQSDSIKALQDKIRRYQELKNFKPMNEQALDDAINERNKRQGMATFLKGTQQIIQGQANRYNPNYKADTSVADTLYKQAEQPVEDVQLKQKMSNDQQRHNDIMAEAAAKLESLNIDLTNMNDNNTVDSNISRLAQQTVKQLRPDFNPSQVDNTPASQLFKLVPELQKLTLNEMKRQKMMTTSNKPYFKNVEINGKVYVHRYNPETQQLENTGQVAGYAPSLIRDSYTGENKLVAKGAGTSKLVDQNPTGEIIPGATEDKSSAYEKLDPKTRENFNKEYKAQFEKDIQDDDVSLGKIQSIKDLGEQIKQGKGNLSAFASQLGSFYQKGVLSDQDVVRYIKRYDVNGMMADAFNKAASGQLSKETVDQILNSLNAVENSRKKFISTQAKQESQKFYNANKQQLDKKGVKPKDLATILHPEYQEEIGPTLDEVRRLDPKTGKTAVFDSKTKKFIRWE